MKSWSGFSMGNPDSNAGRILWIPSEFWTYPAKCYGQAFVMYHWRILAQDCPGFHTPFCSDITKLAACSCLATECCSRRIWFCSAELDSPGPECCLSLQCWLEESRSSIFASRAAILASKAWFTDLTALSTSRSMAFSMLSLSRSKTCSTIFVMKSSFCGLFELLELDSLILFVEIFEGLESSEERVFPPDDIFFFFCIVCPRKGEEDPRFPRSLMWSCTTPNLNLGTKG